MTITVDTSVFVEMILGQERAQECRSFLDEVAKGRINAVLPHSSIHAIEAMIRSQKELSGFLKDIETSRGLEIYDTTLLDEQMIPILSEKAGLDFDDSVQFYVAKRTNSSAIVSFDKHFDGRDIPRREPIQILEELRVNPKKAGSRR